MNSIDRHILINSTYEFTDNLEEIGNTISKVQSILWFKKIISISWWWTWIQVDNIDLQKKISTYSDELKKDIIDNLMKRLRDYDIAILTWWTSWDIPKIASQSAREHDIPTIWVLPYRWKKSSLWKEFLNAEIIVPPIFWDSHYWDESSIYAKLSDWVFMIWWWAWTLVEFSHIMKMNEALKKYNQTVKKIVPITWIPWVSEATHFIPWNEEIKNITFPSKNITNPKEAFEWLRKEIDLDDVLRENV